MHCLDCKAMQDFINHPSIKIIVEKTADQSFDIVPVRVSCTT